MTGYKPSFFIIGVLFSALAIFSVWLRFLSRRLAKQPYGIDDWLIIPALVCSCAWTLNALICTQAGNLGGHTQLTANGDPANLETYRVFLKQYYVLVVLWTPGVGFTKLSVAFLYKRIFATHRFILAAWTMIWFLVLWILAFTLVALFPCAPIHVYWSGSAAAQDAKCINLPAMYIVNKATNAILDLATLILPIACIYRLQIPLRQKLAIVGIFALGGLVLVTGVVRLVTHIRAYYSLRRHELTDLTYEDAPSVLWVAVELPLGVICANLPLMCPVWKSFVRSNFMVRLASRSLVSRQFSDGDFEHPERRVEQEAGAEVARRSALVDEENLEEYSHARCGVISSNSRKTMAEV
ncbi:hypothetical protein BCR34DRAFT_603713 [Clohesyomyces aquaticus]|uniref:Rhodopsin domain-containing protein n=1 Tax=Clohesyomyces aquaticus TaxID=1231657 RepID=A0A1Y1ZCC6_9PLEO|nr:hypothetical protein BCR34DRAFT_603713 [Clohesyomyces aquaticus]